MSDYLPRISSNQESLEESLKRLDKSGLKPSGPLGTKGPIPSEGGTKYDSGKPDLTLLPRGFVEQTAQVLMFGAAKYERDNYKKGLEVTRTLAACLRHVYAYLDNEDNDPESGLPHLAHASACLAMTIENIRIRSATDNRGGK